MNIKKILSSPIINRVKKYKKYFDPHNPYFACNLIFIIKIYSTINIMKTPSLFRDSVIPKVKLISKHIFNDINMK